MTKSVTTFLKTSQADHLSVGDSGFLTHPLRADVVVSINPSTTPFNELCQRGTYHPIVKSHDAECNGLDNPKPPETFREYVANSANYSNITGLLVEWRNGDKIAFDKVLPLVERELRRLAHAYMRRERADHTLQTTALINEAYLKLIDQKKTHWQNRAHFFGVAAQIMRRILLNHARDQHRLKRGGKAVKVSMSEAEIISAKKAEELIALDDALKRLAAIDRRKGQVVELRYFGGLDVQEAAEVLKISQVTVMRDWKFAKAWLKRELENAH